MRLTGDLTKSGRSRSQDLGWGERTEHQWKRALCAARKDPWGHRPRWPTLDACWPSVHQRSTLHLSMYCMYRCTFPTHSEGVRRMTGEPRIIHPASSFHQTPYPPARCRSLVVMVFRRCRGAGVGRDRYSRYSSWSLRRSPPGKMGRSINTGWEGKYRFTLVRIADRLQLHVRTYTPHDGGGL